MVARHCCPAAKLATAEHTVDAVFSPHGLERGGRWGWCAVAKSAKMEWRVWVFETAVTPITRASRCWRSLCVLLGGSLRDSGCCKCSRIAAESARIDFAVRYGDMLLQCCLTSLIPCVLT